MFVSHEREKLVHAIIYFVKNTKTCHKLKLFKLLNFLDFEHFRQTGRTVTGLRYEAWWMGPVPSELDREFESPRPDLAAAIAVFKAPPPGPLERTIDDYVDPREQEAPSGPPQHERHERYNFKTKKRFDAKYFTKRQMRIMKILSEIFRDAPGVDMTEVSHRAQFPWRQIYGQKGEGNHQSIPYELAFSSEAFVKDVPTIEPEEFEYRQEALREVRHFSRA